MDQVLTVVQKEIKKYGKDNIFMLNESYHGLYQDDYCTFTYYNNITGEFFTDEWSTAWAAPHYSNFECKKFKEAFDEGLVNKDLLLNVLKKKMMKTQISDRLHSHLDMLSPLGLMVKVERGRKWKGIGYLIGLKKKSYQWGVKLWRSDNDYGTSTTTYGKIYDPKTNRIEYININNIDFIDEKRFQKEFIELYNNTLNNCTIKDLDYCSIKINHDYLSYVIENTKGVDYSSAFDETEYEEKKKESEFKTKKMNDLIEWIKTNTDKTDEVEILKFAENLFNRNYGK